ncbi:hypothetical protein GCM10009610_07170 [Pseudonocardia xinjiangensis]
MVAVAVERHELHQRHADPVGQAAVDLPFDDHRVDPHAAVVHRDEPADLHLPGARVDVHDADVGQYLGDLGLPDARLTLEQERAP